MSQSKRSDKEKAMLEKLGQPIQPDPVPNDGPSIHDLVIKDMAARKAFGLEKYGTILQANNGRDSLQDIYEELLDALVYIKTAIIERDSE